MSTCRRAVSRVPRARESRDSSASVRSPGCGTCPSQFFAIIDSERWARLPYSLARSAFLRVMIESFVYEPSWP
ncbi:Uncharacterised protein [Mycobacteroides abscessus subsp. abscessus]|nr:Uncharacterised protein [Mycobacteroides abscessus subsp. abscessus]